MAKPSPSHTGHTTLVALGRAIKRKRQSMGLSQEHLALECGIDRSYLGGIERGEHNLALINLKKIARGLKITASQLLEIAGL